MGSGSDHEIVTDCFSFPQILGLLLVRTEHRASECVYDLLLWRLFSDA